MMRLFLTAIPQICVRAWRSLSAATWVLFSESRQALIERSRARTDLEKLAVEQKRDEIAFKRASRALDLAQKVEKIKDPQLREKAKAAITSSGVRMLPEPVTPAAD
jgi:hypothetical protein